METLPFGRFLFPFAMNEKKWLSISTLGRQPLQLKQLLYCLETIVLEFNIDTQSYYMISS